MKRRCEMCLRDQKERRRRVTFGPYWWGCLLCRDCFAVISAWAAERAAHPELHPEGYPDGCKCEPCQGPPIPF